MSYAIVNLLISVINIYLLIIVIWVIASWLQTFGVIDARNPVVRQILSVLDAFVEPVMRPIRRVIPIIGGLDLSPIVVILGLYFILDVLGSFLRSGNIF